MRALQDLMKVVIIGMMKVRIAIPMTTLTIQPLQYIKMTFFSCSTQHVVEFHGHAHRFMNPIINLDNTTLTIQPLQFLQLPSCSYGKLISSHFM